MKHIFLEKVSKVYYLVILVDYVKGIKSKQLATEQTETKTYEGIRNFHFVQIKGLWQDSRAVLGGESSRSF